MRVPLALLVAAGLAACGSKAPAGPADTATPPATSADDARAQAEAAQLGREIFQLEDQVMSYSSSHFGQFPRNLPAAGIDSLTHTTVRRLSVSAKVPTITAAFRQPADHAVRECAATKQVLEDSMLNGGAYTVTCHLADGTARDFTVGG